MGSKNHEIVPTPLIIQLSGLRGGSGVHKCISTLAKVNLIARVKGAKYDGYRLTYGGLDYLALHTHQKRQILYSTGQQIGTGKESDIHVTASPSGAQYALKIHRLGRISFRSVKNNRDYLRHRSSASWMYMSRLAAVKEFAFLTALFENGFPVPRPVAQSRHTLVMELIEGLPLRQVQNVPHPERLYAELIDLVLKLAGVGLIHGDFNEFNILIRENTLPSKSQESGSPRPSTPTVKLTPILIDFPQMLSIDHANAEMYFDRDIACIKHFFQRRFHFTSDEPGPFFADVRLRMSTPTSRPDRNRTTAVAAGAGKGEGKRGRKGMVREGKTAIGKREKESGGSEEGERVAASASGEKDICGRRLDVEVEASGFSKQMAKELEKYMRELGVDGDGDGDAENGDDPNDLKVSADEESDDLGEAENDSPDETGGLDDSQTRKKFVEISVPDD